MRSNLLIYSLYGCSTYIGQQYSETVYPCVRGTHYKKVKRKLLELLLSIGAAILPAVKCLKVAEKTKTNGL